MYGRQVLKKGGQTYCYLHSNSLSNKMGNSLLAVMGINHKYIVVEKRGESSFKRVARSRTPQIMVLPDNLVEKYCKPL